MRARVLAPLLAGVLGLGGGVGTALVTQGDDAATGTQADPLRLGIAQVDPTCTGDAITVLAYGEGRSALGTAVAEAEADGTRVRYLRTGDSCPTVYGSDAADPPTWVVYSGPYASPREPCQTRMAGDDRRGSVTVLTSGNTDFVKCACELPPSAGPELRVGAQPTSRDVAWTRLLQLMLRDDAQRQGDPQAFPGSLVTGRYTQATADRVATYQERSPGKLTERGVVDATTWGILTDRMCKNYSW